VVCVSYFEVAGYDEDVTHGNAVPRENFRSLACVQLRVLNLSCILLFVKMSMGITLLNIYVL
jgi:hypothetical protein